MLEKLNRFNKAEECYLKSLELNPNYYVAWLNLAVLCQDLGRIRDAINCFEKVKELCLNELMRKAIEKRIKRLRKNFKINMLYPNS